MPRMEAECRCLSFDQVNERIQLPDTQTQDQLTTLYFTYVHHFFPVVHKASFLSLYYERCAISFSPVTRLSRMPTGSVVRLVPPLGPPVHAQQARAASRCRP